MTAAQAKALQEKWQQLADQVVCDHPNLELERSEGDLTGHYYCTDCGDLFPIH
jgi:hypothetical protein